MPPGFSTRRSFREGRPVVRQMFEHFGGQDLVEGPVAEGEAGKGGPRDLRALRSEACLPEAPDVGVDSWAATPRSALRRRR